MFIYYSKKKKKLHQKKKKKKKKKLISIKWVFSNKKEKRDDNGKYI